MPPRRAVGVTAEGFRALQRQIEALQEQMRRGMNLPKGMRVKMKKKKDKKIKKNKKNKF